MLPAHYGSSWVAVLLLLTLLLLQVCGLSSASSGETCYSRQHRDAIVNARLAMESKGTVMDARTKQAEKDCILACCSQEVKPGIKCNMVVYKPSNQPGSENCYLFHCETEQDCPLAAKPGTNTYDIFKGTTHPSIKVSSRTTLMPIMSTTQTQQPTTTKSTSTTTELTTIQPTTTISRIKQVKQASTTTTTTKPTTTTSTTPAPSTTTTLPTTTTTKATTTALPTETIILVTMPVVTMPTSPVTPVTTTTTPTTTQSTSTTTKATSTASPTTTTTATTTTRPARPAQIARRPKPPQPPQTPQPPQPPQHPQPPQPPQPPQHPQLPQGQVRPMKPPKKPSNPLKRPEPHAGKPSSKETEVLTIKPTTTTTTTQKPTTVTKPTTTTTSTTTTTTPTTTTTTTTTTTSTVNADRTTIVVVEMENDQKDLALGPDTLMPPAAGSDPDKAKQSHVTWKNGLVAAVVVTLIFLTLILAIAGRKAMESFDRRHYTRLELNDLHYEI